jgi:hypothetical protein
MKNQFIRFAIAALAIFSVFYATGCPAKTDSAIREAAKASYRLPAATNDLIAQVKEGTARGIFTVEQAHTWGIYSVTLAKSEKKFVAAVKVAELTYRKTGGVPAADLDTLKKLFDREVVAAFLNVLEQFKVLTPNASAILATAIATVRVLLTTIGSGIGSTLLNLIAAADSPGSIRPTASYPNLRLINV